MEPFVFDEMVDVSELESLNNDIRKIDPVQVKGMCTVDGDDLIFSYTIEGKMILPCARTLVDVEYPFNFDVSEVYTSTEREDSKNTDIIVHQISEDVLDLTPYIMENIILETPYRVFSDEKPLEGGQGWSYYTEDKLSVANADKIDPRLEKLKELLNKNNDETEK